MAVAIAAPVEAPASIPGGVKAGDLVVVEWKMGGPVRPYTLSFGEDCVAEFATEDGVVGDAFHAACVWSLEEYAARGAC